GSTPTPAPEAVAAAPTTTPAEAKARLGDAVKPGASEITLAEQLGLKVRRVVIDAGHGGHDTGAIGKKGTREKDVTLAVSRRVAEILSERGLEVILTRNDDTYVRLEDRSRIANEAKGDLFISIHCNAAESRKLRGIETYSLNVAGDRYSIRLAARENASSEKSISDLQFILADLATKANTDESQRLAARVQRSLVTRLSSNYREIKDLGTKEALFYVLLGAKMPAILVEASFLSHPEEEKRLASKAYQDHIAQSVAEGIEAFLADRQRVAKVD
ncbi:MAG: N-acetylmuramoyl-L-alanine amidase, partial [Myxococcaceae bacterium]